MKSTFWRTDSNDWKEYIAKPALKYILRFLTGLAHDHKPTQVCFCFFLSSLDCKDSFMHDSDQIRGKNRTLYFASSKLLLNFFFFFFLVNNLENFVRCMEITFLRR